MSTALETTSPASLEAQARLMLPNADDAMIAIAVKLLAMDDESLIEGTGAADAFVRNREAEVFGDLNRELYVDRHVVAIGKAIMLHRITERGAKMLPSDTYKCAIEASKTIEKRIDVLRGLEGKVPADRLKKALWVDGLSTKGVEPQVVQAAIDGGAKPEYKADATQLKKLASDFGGQVAQIVSEGLVYAEGAPRLVFEPLETAQKNVTGTAA